MAKECFVIAPIGEEGTEIRRHSDQVLKHIVRPAVAECGYSEPLRADGISSPGVITSQIIQRLLKDDLVVADLTGHNANVFYEIAIRHAVRKPMVQLIAEGDTIPFDVAQSRTIRFNLKDLDSVERCKAELMRQIKSVERDPGYVDSPLSVAIDLQRLRESQNPLEKSSAIIISMLQEIIGKLNSVVELPPSLGFPGSPSGASYPRLPGLLGATGATGYVHLSDLMRPGFFGPVASPQPDPSKGEERG